MINITTSKPNVGNEMNFWDELNAINKSFCASLGLPTDTYDRDLSKSEQTGRLSADELYIAHMMKIAAMMTEAEIETLDARRTAIFHGDMMKGRDLPGLPAAAYKRETA